MRDLMIPRRSDRWETVIHAALGLAVVLALGSYYSAIVRVADRAPQIAHQLRSHPGTAAELLVATGDTNAAERVQPPRSAVLEPLDRTTPRAPRRVTSLLPPIDG